jgi:hypothetical protein
MFWKAEGRVKYDDEKIFVKRILNKTFVVWILCVDFWLTFAWKQFSKPAIIIANLRGLLTIGFVNLSNDMGNCLICWVVFFAKFVSYICLKKTVVIDCDF